MQFAAVVTHPIVLQLQEDCDSVLSIIHSQMAGDSNQFPAAHRPFLLHAEETQFPQHLLSYNDLQPLKLLKAPPLHLTTFS